MAAVLEVERKLIALFVQKNKIERFSERIGSSKNRHKIWDDLRDTRYLDPRCLTVVAGGDRQSDAIAKRLERLGVGESVYLMSSDDDLDGREMSLREVLRSVWEPEEVLGFCQQSEVGFFKNHEDEFYILRRASP